MINEQGQSIRFGKQSPKPKGFTGKYRWTEEEKLTVLDELNADVTIQLKPVVGFLALENVADSEQRFNVMGHYTTGFSSLDRLCLGFDQGEYIVLGAPTNGGKTQLATYIAKTQAQAGVPTLYISRELSNDEMKKRFRYIGGSNLNNLHVPESSRLSPDELLQTIRDFTAKYPNAFVIVDHLHAFYRGSDLTEALGLFSAGLRELAQELNITIMALSQFNRQPFKDDEGPTNYHLKESGYIADDAYTILLGWRTQAGLNIRLTKTRRLDLGDLSSPVITLKAGKGLLSDPDQNLQETFI